jgi:hypothetical protein
VTDQEVGSPVGDLRGEVEKCVDDVLSAAQSVGSGRPAHAGEVRIDPPKPCDAVEGRLETGRRLAVVDASPVQHQHRSASSVLHVVECDLAGSSLHVGNPTTHHRQVETVAMSLTA